MRTNYQNMNMNKNQIKTFIMLSIIFYVIFSFIEASLNPMDWGNKARAFYSIGGFVSFIKLIHD